MESSRSRVMDTLAASTLFRGLEDDALAHIADGFSLVKFRDGEDIFHQNDEADYLYIVERGHASIFKKMGQGERKVGQLGPGEHFGEMAMISNEKRNATLRAAGELTCVRMDAKGFDTLIEEDARFAQRMLAALSERLRTSDEAAIREAVRRGGAARRCGEAVRRGGAARRCGEALRRGGAAGARGK
jgi:CRP-like cAMP-binding protein